MRDKDQPRPAVISPALLSSPVIIISSCSLYFLSLSLSPLIQVAMTPQDGSFQFSLTSPSNCPLLLQLSLLLISLIKKCCICILNQPLSGLFFFLLNPKTSSIFLECWVEINAQRWSVTKWERMKKSFGRRARKGDDWLLWTLKAGPWVGNYGEELRAGEKTK